jgi:hypothetical protein
MKFKDILYIEVTRNMLKRENEYSWKRVPGDGPPLDPDRFCRKEGYEVKDMIQKIVKHFGYMKKSDVHKVEDAIWDKLPGNVQNREKVKDWLVNYLSKR